MTLYAKRTAIVGRAELPDGTVIDVADVQARGFELESWGEYDVRRASDRAARSQHAPAPVAKSKASALIAYAEAIEALPEAQLRPAATSAIWSKHTLETMPLDRAAAFLRGLPVESTPDVPTVAASTISARDNEIFKRKLQIQIVGLNMRADHGGGPAVRNEAIKLGWALRTRETTGCSFAEAFTGAGLDARVTITKILEMAH